MQKLSILSSTVTFRIIESGRVRITFSEGHFCKKKGARVTNRVGKVIVYNQSVVDTCLLFGHRFNCHVQ